jgi:hypothetical protein
MHAWGWRWSVPAAHLAAAAGVVISIATTLIVTVATRAVAAVAATTAVTVAAVTVMTPTAAVATTAPVAIGDMACGLNRLGRNTFGRAVAQCHHENYTVHF